MEHRPQRGGTDSASDEHLFDRHTEILPQLRYAHVTPVLTMCCMRKMRQKAYALGVAAALMAGTLPAPVAWATELAFRNAPDFPPSDSWIKGRHYEGKDVWFNSPPLHFKDLPGKVILIDFWEYTCINCIRTFDYLKEWDERYRSLGLVIIGVHAPEFDFAYDPQNVKRAVKRFGLKFPIVVDSDFRIWRSYGNNTWPNKFLIGPDHRILFSHSGEGNYAEFERQIRLALQAANPKATFPPGQTIKEDRDAWSPSCGDTTQEVYTGTARGGVGPFSHRGAQEDGAPYVQGNWQAEPDAQRTQAPVTTNTFLGLRYHGAEIFAVLSTSDRPLRVYIEQDGRPLDQAHAQNDVHLDAQGRGYLEVGEPRMYYLARNSDDQPHDIRLIPSAPGLAVYSFTFGNRCLARFSHL